MNTRPAGRTPVRDALLLGALLVAGGYVWVWHTDLVASLLLAYVVIGMLTLIVAAVLRWLGVVPSGAKR